MSCTLLKGFPISSHTMGQRSMTFWVTGAKEFERLAAVAKLVLVLPHANADAERVFSVVGLNKTKRRNSLALDGTTAQCMLVRFVSDLIPTFSDVMHTHLHCKEKEEKSSTGHVCHATHGTTLRRRHLLCSLRGA
ncbi:hypothetical protein J4Q44_G00384920 [Coregonus suidteri]|uniref:HAT C-terminal dimerisation domain-containing protein n=1 Tax=Coregonus suidteri TaxID=861788 RepID=A0AAN8Q498_9TELE